MPAATDQHGRPHYCHDETVVVVDGRWRCQCPGGPYFASEEARIAWCLQRGPRPVDSTPESA